MCIRPEIFQTHPAQLSLLHRAMKKLASKLYRSQVSSLYPNKLQHFRQCVEINTQKQSLYLAVAQVVRARINFFMVMCISISTCAFGNS